MLPLVRVIRRVAAYRYFSSNEAVFNIGDVLEEREKAKLSSNDGKIAHFETWERIGATESVEKAVSRMVENQVGSLIVTKEGDGVVGIVTERDILNRLSPHEALAPDILVQSIMSSHIMCIHSSTTVMDALASMSKKRFRHFAVIHEKDHVKDHVPEEAMRCVLSIKDIMNSYYSRYKVSSDDQITAADLLKTKTKKFKLILNARIEDDATVAEAVEDMSHHGIGSVLIVDDGQHIRGIFTERDYLKDVVFQHKNPKDVLLKDVCTRNVFTISPEESLNTCVDHCAHKPFRHFPVVDSNKAIVGVLSIKDIVKEISKGHDASPGFWLMEYFRSKMETKSNVIESDSSKVSSNAK